MYDGGVMRDRGMLIWLAFGLLLVGFVACRESALPLAQPAPAVLEVAHGDGGALDQATEESAQTRNVCPPAIEGGAPSSIRDFDFCACEIPGMGERLHDCSFELREYESMDQPHDTDSWTAFRPTFGDVDGDGNDDALQTIRHQSSPPSGAGATETTVIVYTMAGGAVLRAAEAVFPGEVRVMAVVSGKVQAFSVDDHEVCRLTFGLGPGERAVRELTTVERNCTTR